jgi:TRAP-type C4-dicarboxylate transport system permease large subunit
LTKRPNAASSVTCIVTDTFSPQKTAFLRGGDAGLTKFNRIPLLGTCFCILLIISYKERKIIQYSKRLKISDAKKSGKMLAREKIVIILHPILTTEYYCLLFKSTKEMKKLVLALAVIASVSMISCTNNNTEATAEEAVDTTAVVEEVVDSAAAVVDSTAAVVDSAATEAAAPEAAPAE